MNDMDLHHGPLPTLGAWRDSFVRPGIGLVALALIVIGPTQCARGGWELGLILCALGLILAGWWKLDRPGTYRQRVCLIAAIFLLWAGSLVALGWVPGVVAAAVLLVTLAGVFLGRRHMWAMLALLTMSSSIVVAAIFAGVFAPPVAQVFEVGDPLHWFVTGTATYVCIWFGAIAIGRAVELRRTGVARLHQTVELLETQAAERRRLRLEEARLLDRLEESWSMRVASAVGPSLSHVFNNALTAGLAATETARLSGERSDELEAVWVIDEMVTSCLEGAGYLLSLARPDRAEHEFAHVDAIEGLIEDIRGRLRENIDVTIELGARGPLLLTRKGLDELLTLLLSYTAGALPTGGKIAVRTTAYDESGAQTLDQGDWVVLEASATTSFESQDRALMAILVETARRAGAVVHSSCTPTAVTTRVYLPLTMSLEHEPAPELPVLEDTSGLGVLLGLAAATTLAASASLAIDEAERAVMWLGLGLVTAAPLIWGAFSRSMSASARLAALIIPLTAVAAGTLIIDGFNRPLAVAVLCTSALAAAGYGSRRVRDISLAVIAVSFAGGAIVQFGAPTPPPHDMVDWLRYGILVPATCVLSALVVSERLQRTEAVIPALVRARQRLETERVGLDDADATLDGLRQASEGVAEASAAGRQVTVLAHDISNCLTVMSGWAAMLAIVEDDDERAEALEAIDQACRHAQAVVESFGQGVSQRPLVAVDLNTELWQMKPLLDALVVHDTQSLELVLDPNAGWVEADGQLLRRALLNLVTNACAAIDRDGNIRVATVAGNPPSVVVSDDGDGMDARTLALAKRPTFTTKGSKGTGLGLSSVDEIMKSFGGELVIDSTERQGTTVSLRFVPTARAEVTDALAKRISRVLVVDDEPLIVRSLARGLRRAEFDVEEAGSRERAIALIAQQSFDGICCDVVMPGSSMVPVLLAFRHANPDSVIVLMSGYTQPPLPDELLSCVTFLPKPLTTSDVIGAFEARYAASGAALA